MLSVRPYPIVRHRRGTVARACAGYVAGGLELGGNVAQLAFASIDSIARKFLGERDCLRRQLSDAVPAAALACRSLLRSRASSFVTRAAFSNGDTAPRTCRMKTAVGVSSTKVSGDPGIAEEAPTGFLYDQVASKTASGFDEDGPNVIATDVLEHAAKPARWSIGCAPLASSSEYSYTM
jgi:hypothetical protein